MGWRLKTGAGSGNFNYERERDFGFLSGRDERIARERSGIRYFNFYETARFDQRRLIQVDSLRMTCVGFQVMNQPRQSSLHVKLV